MQKIIQGMPSRVHAISEAGWITLMDATTQCIISKGSVGRTPCFFMSAVLSVLVSTQGHADVTNLDEYIADTDPNDPASFFNVEGLSFSPTPSVSVDSSSNRIYTLQFVNALGTNDWLDVPPPEPGNGGVLSLSDTNSGASSFRAYRVDVALPP